MFSRKDHVTPGDHVVEYVDAYLHDVLDPRDMRYVRQHVQSCRICQTALQEAQRRYDAMQSVPGEQASAGLLATTEKRIEAYRPPLVTLRRVCVAVAAALLLVAVGFQGYYFRLSNTPYDLQVLWQSELLADSDASLRVFLVDHDTREPLSGVPVELELTVPNTEQRVHLASFTTDRWGTGSPRVRLPNWAPGKYQLRVVAQTGDEPESIVEPIQLQRSWQLMLSSDKPVYQPGQTIHVRSLARARPAGKPSAGLPVEFTISDSLGNRIFRQESVTSRFGITSIDCPLATEIHEGTYRIECRIDDTTSTLAVEVSKYVLPKLRVAVNMNQPYYLPGQRVRAAVQADYFFGQPVANAQVNVKVSTEDIGTTEIYAASSTTDEAGQGTFEFVVPETLVGRPQTLGAATLLIAATVEDTAGQKATRYLSCTVAPQPIRIAAIPESGTLVQGVENKVFVYTSYPDGQPVLCRIAITGYEQEFETDEFGIAEITITPPKDSNPRQPPEPLNWTMRQPTRRGTAVSVM